MAIQPPLQDLSIQTDTTGFYTNFNKVVALASKITIALIVFWSAVFPDQAGAALGAMKTWSFNNLNYYYTWSVVFFHCLLNHIVASSMGKNYFG